MSSDEETSDGQKDSESSLLGVNDSPNGFVATHWYDWFKHFPLYVFAVIFLAARLANNSLSTYVTLYVSDTIKLEPTYLATLPFVQYVFGLLGALATKPIAKHRSTATAYVLGSGIMLLACLWVSYIGTPEETPQAWTFYAIFALYGGGANMLVCSAYGLVAEFIGSNIQYSSFVYGIFGLGDKVINGLVIKFLEENNPCQDEDPTVTAAATIEAATIAALPTNSTMECISKECDYYGEFISKGTGCILLIGVGFIALQAVLFPTKKVDQPETSPEEVAKKNEEDQGKIVLE